MCVCFRVVFLFVLLLLLLLLVFVLVVVVVAVVVAVVLFFGLHCKRGKEKENFKGRTSECPGVPSVATVFVIRRLLYPLMGTCQHFREIKGCRELRNQMPRILKVAVIHVFVFLILLFPFKDFSFASQIGMGWHFNSQ